MDNSVYIQEINVQANNRFRTASNDSVDYNVHIQLHRLKRERDAPLWT